MKKNEKYIDGHQRSDHRMPQNGLFRHRRTNNVQLRFLADLLLGLYHPTKGGITVDGKSFTDYSLKSWREKAEYVGRKPVIFNAGVRGNILAGRPDAAEDEMIQAARTAGI
jgi:ABC-type transport system involved in Fe-S cluster assembly fused permease/ATPase subunit